MKILYETVFSTAKAIVIFLCFLMPVHISVCYAQEATDEQKVFVNAALKRVTTKMAEDEDQQKSELIARLNAEQQSRKDLEEIEGEKVKSEQKLRDRIAAETVEIQILASVPNNNRAVLDTARGKLNDRISARVKAEQDLRRLSEAENEATARAKLDAAAREQTEASLREKARQRVKLIEELERLTTVWKQRPTEDNYIDLVEKIMQIAKEKAVKSNVRLSSNPQPGAVIRYQSLWDRKHSVAALTAKNPTSTIEEMIVGDYYIWSERAGTPTSDKNKNYPINKKEETITIVEN